MPLCLAQENAIQNLTWFKKLTYMFSLIWQHIGVSFLSVLILSGVYYVMYLFYKKAKSEIRESISGTIELINKNIEYERLVNEMRENANKNKMHYLFKCIQQGKILPTPIKWFTELELKLMNEKAANLEIDINKITENINHEL